MKKVLFILMFLISFDANAFQKDIYDNIVIEVDNLFDKCFNEKKTDNLSNVGMQGYAIQSNLCLEENLKKEIFKAYDKKKATKAWDSYQQMVEATRDFYRLYHNENKYCFPQCGTIAQSFPISDWKKLIKKTLTDIMYLNKTKDSY